MKNKLRLEIASRMRRVREKEGLTQEQIAKYLSVGRANYSRMEKGEIFPNELAYLRLRREFGISLDWLIAGEGPMIPVEPPRDGPAICEQELKQLEFMINRLPMVKHAILGYFLEYQYKNEELIQKLLEEADRKEGIIPKKSKKK